MKRQRGIAFLILFLFTFNFIILPNNDLACADEPEVLWLEKDYGHLYSFSEGLAEVSLNGKYGYINKGGQEVIPLIYEYTGSFSEGLAPVKMNGKFGYIDKSGQEVISFQYEQADLFSEGLAPVKMNGKFGYIDKSGQEVIPFKYEQAALFSEGLAPVKINGKFGYIDKSGQEVIPFKYEQAALFSEGLAPVKMNGKFGYIGKKGQEVLTFQYDFADLFSEGLAVVGLNSKYGYIDKTGIEVIPLNYDGVGYFSEGLAVVGVHRYGHAYFGYMDKAEQRVVAMEYNWAGPFSDGVAFVLSNGRLGIMQKPLITKEIIFKNPAIINIIKGSKNYLNISTEPRNVELTYTSKDPDLIKVLPNGEIIGLKAGKGEVEVIAQRWGFNENKIIIPIQINAPLAIDLSWISKNKKLKKISGQLEEVLASAEAFYFEDATSLKQIVKYINLSIQKLANSTIKAKNNQVIINAKNIDSPIKKAGESKSEFEGLLERYQINLDRDISSTINLNIAKLNPKKPIIIKLTADLKDKLQQIDAINIRTELAEITLETDSLIKELIKTKELIIQIEPKELDTKIVFFDDKNQVINKLANNISIELPITRGEAEASSVFYKDGAIEEQLGGQYNPVRKTMSFETSRSGEYYIAASHKDYKDIDHLSEEEKQAIAYMTSKGYIADKGEKIFEPDAEITRAEFTAFIVKVFYVLDRDLKVSFADVSEEDWYYNYVASSEHEGIIKGFPDNTFRADEIIDREQIVAVCTRALHEKKKYLYPEDPTGLIPFLDSEEISEWAQKEIALAYRETLIDMTDNRSFEPQKPMTRADATLIVYRLFQLLYETSPEAIDTSSPTSELPIIPMAGGAGLIGLGLLGGYLYKRKRLDQVA